ncbi:sulfite exporter TauE/SafE family protein [Streptomyces sp. B3I8]|uniref:HoxN/HupN/NixA family nickel/cobalt transporter n=1 Tax=Streptomyces sp. B3I8 TaxID=3042303 RepID=UPI00278417D0|nr:sulfite exporter TauE/SafE family protein [Streptomyces sp. B3I8]MDQ0786127.1 nickel/cobalt exporter [Streptomyces sp. B3I8]
MRARHRRFATGAGLLTAAAALVLLPAGQAAAHPLGNFTVNRYDGLVAAPGHLRVDHVEDLAEIPATQAGPDIERAGGLTAWAGQRCAEAAHGSAVSVAGRAARLTVATSSAHRRPGQAGLDTLRVECRLTAPLPDTDTVRVRFRSAGGTAFGPGWREITARGDRTTLAGTDVPAKSVSHELTAYPKELLSSPAHTARASFEVRPGGPALDRERQDDAPASSVLPRGADRWTRALDGLVARQDLTLGFATLAVLLAVGLGAMHALAPGHGKTLMAATAAARGGRARPRDVLPLAASVTVTHTLGVVALGLLVTAGSAAAPSVITWLGLASGAVVTAAGITLLRRAWRHRAAHEKEHGHGHLHPHGPERAEGHEHPHAHEPEPEHTHDHDHDHDHPHTHTHTHGYGRPHTHPTAPTLRGTLLLGFAGGLVPSPSAVVVLVGAAALGQAWFGLLLVVAYGVGLALTLTAAGFAVVRLGGGLNRLLDRHPRRSGGAAALVRRTAPLGSACVVLLLGAGLVLRGAATALG